MPKKPQTELIKQYFEFALGIMLTTAFTVLKLPRFGELYKVDPVHAILSIVLFVVTFAFFAGWIYFDHREIQLMETYIDTEKTKRVKAGTFVMAIFISLFSGVLIGVSDQPRFYVALLMANLIISAIGYKTVCKHLRFLYDTQDDYQKGPRKLIYEYYINHHFMALDYVTLTFFLIALVLAWYAYFSKESLYLYLSYGITILTLIGHESFVWRWRIDRDRLIDQYEEEELRRLAAAKRAKRLKQPPQPDQDQPE